LLPRDWGAKAPRSHFYGDIAVLKIIAISTTFVIWTTAGAAALDVETYRHSDKVVLMAKIETPQSAGPFPVVMTIHGGAFTNARRDRTRFEQSFFDHFTSRGIAVMSVEYRVVGEGGAYPEAIKDSMHNLHWLIDNAETYRFDTSSITMLGSSSGSYLAMMVALTSDRGDYQPDFGPYKNRRATVRATICHAGIYDWTAIGKGKEFIGPHRSEKDASPINRSGQGTCKSFLLLGGEKDTEWSPPQAARAMQSSLKKNGRYCELHLKKDEGHTGLYDDTSEFSKWAFAYIDEFIVAKMLSDKPTLIMHSLKHHLCLKRAYQFHSIFHSAAISRSNKPERMYCINGSLVKNAHPSVARILLGRQ